MSNLPKKGPGRPAGSVNKATASAREAIAMFVDGNAHRLGEWLDQVAQGVPKLDAEGNFTGEWQTPPSPEKAFNMWQSVVEYHIPKLARTEVSGKMDLDVQADVHVNVFGELLKSLKMQKQLGDS